MCSDKSGATTKIIIALLMVFLVISISFLSSGFQRRLEPSLTLILKADYHMESAIIGVIQQLKAGVLKPEGSIQSSRKIAPQIELLLKTHHLKEKVFQFNASVTGPGINRKLVARVDLARPNLISFYKPEHEH